jgi:hypothetical protein
MLLEEDICPGGDFKMMLLIGLFIGGFVGFCACSLFAVNNYNAGYKDGREWERLKK